MSYIVLNNFGITVACHAETCNFPEKKESRQQWKWMSNFCYYTIHDTKMLQFYPFTNL